MGKIIYLNVPGANFRRPKLNKAQQETMDREDEINMRETLERMSRKWAIPPEHKQIKTKK